MTDNQAAIAERATAVATTPPADKGEVTVEDVLRVQEREIARALPSGMTAERFGRVVLTEVKRTPRLRQCTVKSLLASVMLAAQLGLEPGPLGLSYLVPRRNKGTWEVQFQIGYRGMIDLAMRSGMVREVAAHVVYEADEFEFEEGTEPFLRHRRSLAPDRGAIVCAYAVARNTSGGAPFAVLSVSEIEARRARGAAGDTGPWITDWPAMARKTAVRALEPYLPRSVELAQAARFDGAVVTDFTAQNIVETEPEPDDVIDVEGEEEGDETAGAGAPADSGATASEDAPPSASTAADQDAPAPDGTDDGQLYMAGARREVASYRATKNAAGAANKHRALDAYLNDQGIDMELENITPDQAKELLEYLEKQPIGKRRGDA